MFIYAVAEYNREGTSERGNEQRQSRSFIILFFYSVYVVLISTWRALFYLGERRDIVDFPDVRGECYYQ